MRIEEITINNKKTYLLLDGRGKPIVSVAKYLKYLHNKERSSNTILTYCTGIMHYFKYIEEEKMDYRQVNLELLSNFVAGLRNPYGSNKIVPHKKVKAKRSEKTVNLYITAVTSFYDYLYRNEMIDSDIVEKLMKKMFVGAGGKGYKSFLHHVNEDKPRVKNILKFDEPKSRVKVLTKQEVEIIYHATTNIRDRFLVRLLFESGLRIGECLALFLEDFQFDSKHRKHKIQLTDRGALPNGGKLKTGERGLDISQGLMDLYDDYLYEVIDEFNPDHNFILVKLRGKNPGQPMTYSDVYATFNELEKKTGIYITPHIFRHTHATFYYLQTKNIKLVQERLSHAQIQTTIDLYVHPSEEEIRQDWEKAAHTFEIRQTNNREECTSEE